MSAILKAGDLIHVILRRNFEGEPRRHFVGTVLSCSESLARVEGWPWLFDAAKNTFVRSQESRQRIVSLTDASNLVHVLPPDVKIEDIAYKVQAQGHYMVSDGKAFQMDVNEFGPRR